MAENRKYRIRVDGILVDVSEEVYHAYYSMERHTRTLDEKDIRNGKVLYSDLDTDELLGEEMLPNRNAEQVEDSAICRVLREKLHHQLAMLSAQDIRPAQGSCFCRWATTPAPSSLTREVRSGRWMIWERCTVILITADSLALSPARTVSAD